MRKTVKNCRKLGKVLQGWSLPQLTYRKDRMRFRKSNSISSAKFSVFLPILHTKAAKWIWKFVSKEGFFCIFQHTTLAKCSSINFFSNETYFFLIEHEKIENKSYSYFWKKCSRRLIFYFKVEIKQFLENTFCVGGACTWPETIMNLKHIIRASSHNWIYCSYYHTAGVSGTSKCRFFELLFAFSNTASDFLLATVWRKWPRVTQTWP